MERYVRNDLLCPDLKNAIWTDVSLRIHNTVVVRASNLPSDTFTMNGMIVTPILWSIHFMGMRHGLSLIRKFSPVLRACNTESQPLYLLGLTRNRPIYVRHHHRNELHPSLVWMKQYCWFAWEVLFSNFLMRFMETGDHFISVSIFGE